MPRFKIKIKSNVYTFQDSSLDNDYHIRSSFLLYHRVVYKDYVLDVYKDLVLRQNRKVLDKLDYLLREHINKPDIVDEILNSIVAHTCDQVVKLIQEDPYVHIVEPPRQSPLTLALKWMVGPSYTSMIDNLPSIDNSQNQYLKQLASMSYAYIIERLIEMEAQHDQHGINQVLELAAEANNKIMVEKLLSMSDINKPNQYGINAALASAAAHNHPAIVDTLLTLTGDNKPSQHGVDMALKSAVANNHLAIFDTLLALTGDNKPSQRELNATLKLAVYNNIPYICNKLLSLTEESTAHEEVILAVLKKAIINDMRDLITKILSMTGNNRPTPKAMLYLFKIHNHPFLDEKDNREHYFKDDEDVTIYGISVATKKFLTWISGGISAQQSSGRSQHAFYSHDDAGLSFITGELLSCLEDPHKSNAEKFDATMKTLDRVKGKSRATTFIHYLYQEVVPDEIEITQSSYHIKRLRMNLCEALYEELLCNDEKTGSIVSKL